MTMTAGRDDTALGVARTRFVHALPKKAEELKGAVALLVATPDAERPREEMRRRLHALYASAQVFRIEALADMLRDSIQRLDTARDQGRGLGRDDLDLLATLVRALPSLGDLPVPEGPPLDDDEDTRPLLADRLAGALKPGSVRPAPPRDSSRNVSPNATPPMGAIDPPPSPASRPTSAPPPKPSSRALPDLAPVLSVLVVDDLEVQGFVRAALPAAHYEVVTTTDPEEGLRLARSSAPDVVLADRALVLRPGVDFIGRLRNDPLTDFVPVVLLLPPGAPDDPIAVREVGADDAAHKPLDAQVLARTIRRVTGALSDSPFLLKPVGDCTLAEVSRAIAAEVERALVDSAQTGKELKIPLGDGSEMFAAVWSSLAGIRAHLTQRSGGRVSFRDAPTRGGPALLALVDDDHDTAPDVVDVSLVGRRIIVADDDPAVVWFFAGLLREAGAEVVETEDGHEALAAARARRPDVIVSDILMPELDGFGLIRELERDPALADVPVILLSWKEDFLHRMRELRVGARGYLRKEAGSALILRRVRDVLRPRARVEAQLRTGGEVRGRIEGLGVIPLLRTVSQQRPDARVSIRDAWNLFEVDLRDRRIVDATRTATDGTFARGMAVMPILLGVTAGRFAVVHSEGPTRPTLEGSLEATLEAGTRRLGALLEAVSGTGLLSASRIVLDDALLPAFLRTSPGPVREVVEKIALGAEPRAMMMEEIGRAHV